MSLTHSSILGFAVERRCSAHGQAFAQSQICYQRLQNQSDRPFVGWPRRSFVGAEDVLELATVLARAASRRPSSDSVKPFAYRQRATPKVARTAHPRGRVAAVLMEKMPGVSQRPWRRPANFVG